ncbi:PucR family transcriptional regulator [Mycobacterium sp. CBMA271]|uniref:PucR family transcriptional regulator n=1 Tax=unclassified Mycobacteroides TaxID=2618759 RepID=UPI00132BEB7E|nr:MULTISPECIES: PucR family transcriptional regulator [unclassified Mycobacteroides]MUM21267.1 PucR family transcriptional regulator [Mycobacteroides sp. CBMA 271]
MRWVLDQPDLKLTLKGGAAGLGREINLALTTELADPAQWLSGGELVLTTGIGLPASVRGRQNYLRVLDENGVAALGFGTGLTFDEVPPELIAVADELGMPLLEVPLRAPFAAVVKAVSSRIAELEYDAVLRASRAQPRITRAIVNGGVQAVTAELGRSLRASVVVLDSGGTVVASHPRNLDVATVNLVRGALSPGASAGVQLLEPGVAVSLQTIGVGGTSYGVLAVVSKAPLTFVDQVLLGHANSLLALDFDKPSRLQEAQRQLNGQALGLLLGDERNLDSVWAQLGQAADGRGKIRVLAVDMDLASGSAATLRRVQAVLTGAMESAGYAVFAHIAECQLTVVLRGSETADSARQLFAEVDGRTRKALRVGLSGAHPVGRLVDAAQNAKLAASVAERGGTPLEFTSLAGSALLSFGASREVLVAVANATLAPVAEHDASHGTDLMASLRAYLEANGHWESAATAVGVHRHTLRKRIETTQSLLACDLDIARVRAELLLAMLAGTPTVGN